MSQVRYKLVLGKFRVTKVGKAPVGYWFHLDLPGTPGLVIEVPLHADVRENDLLTLYTEVLTDAQPFPTSKQ